MNNYEHENYDDSAMMSKERPYDCLKYINDIYVVDQKKSDDFDGCILSVKIAHGAGFFKIYTIIAFVLFIIMILINVQAVSKSGFNGPCFGGLLLTILFILVGVWSLLFGEYIKFYPDRIETFSGLFPRKDRFKKFYCGGNYMIEIRYTGCVYIDKHSVAMNLDRKEAVRMVNYLEFYLNGN